MRNKASRGLQLSGSTTIRIRAGSADSTEGDWRVSFVLEKGEYDKATLDRVREEVGMGGTPKENPSELFFILPHGSTSRLHRAMAILNEEFPSVTFVAPAGTTRNILNTRSTPVEIEKK